MKIMNGGIVHGQALEFERLDESDQELLEYGILEFRAGPSCTAGNLHEHPRTGDRRGRQVACARARGQEAPHRTVGAQRQVHHARPAEAAGTGGPGGGAEPDHGDPAKGLHLKELPVHIECLTTRTSKARTPLPLAWSSRRPSRQIRLPKFNIKTVEGRTTSPPWRKWYTGVQASSRRGLAPAPAHHRGRRQGATVQRCRCP